MNENNEVVSDKTAKAVKDKPPVDPTARYRNPLSLGKVRNDPCICGSGKKIKKCHGRDSAVSFEGAQEIRGLIQRYAAARDALRAKALAFAKEKLEEGIEVDPRELAAMTYHDEIIKRMKEIKERESE
jgi:hypothetical protein